MLGIVVGEVLIFNYKNMKNIQKIMCSNLDWYTCMVYNFVSFHPFITMSIGVIIIIMLYKLFSKSNYPFNDTNKQTQKDIEETEEIEKDYKYLIDIWTAFNYETNEYTLNNRQLSFTSSEKEKIISIGSFIITELNVWSEADDWKYEITISLWDSEETYYTDKYDILWENYIQFINSDWDKITAVWKINIIESV